MSVHMAPHQLAFWRELLAPFDASELSEVPARGSKKVLTYLDKRALSNRLDSVCGPDGWDVSYEATNRGYKARVGIMCPGKVEGVWIWHYKEDGAGFEEMGSKNRETGEFEYDVDNDEKSGYTNAFRRAAQDAWGIGRYLYKKGIPTFLDPSAAPPARSHAPAPSPSAEPAQAQASTPAAAPAPQRKSFDSFKIPPPGKAVFSWAKKMEETFETEIVKGMGRDGEEEGWGSMFSTWNQEQVNTICLKAIKFIRELPTYKGQFEHMFPGGSLDNAIPTVSGMNKPAPAVAATPGVNLADLRKTLVTTIKALIHRQTGAPASNDQLKSAFQEIAPLCADSAGNTGEIPDSLAALSDAVWIGNMVAFAQKQAAEAMAIPAGDDSVPF